jgi:hypothetical protein
MALAAGHRRLWEAIRAGRPAGLALGALALALLAWLPSGGRFYLENAPHYWMGPGFLVLAGLLAVAAGRLFGHLRAGSAPPVALVGWTLIGAYGLLVATRTLMLGYNDYTRYQAPVALIAWVGLACRWLPTWLATGPARPAALGALAGIVLVLGGVQATTEAREYLKPHVAVSSREGTVLARPRFALPFLAALHHVRTHTQPGDKIVAAPMEASFYLFSGHDNVLHEDQLFWGYLTTHAEQQDAIRRIERAKVRYVLVSSYAMGPHVFGRNFMEDLGVWIDTRCRLVGDFAEPGYRVRVYATPYAPDYAAAATGYVNHGR